MLGNLGSLAAIVAFHLVALGKLGKGNLLLNAVDLDRGFQGCVEIVNLNPQLLGQAANGVGKCLVFLSLTRLVWFCRYVRAFFRRFGILRTGLACVGCGWFFRLWLRSFETALVVSGRFFALVGVYGCSFLLRLGFLESKKRGPFWDAVMQDKLLRKVWVLRERPSFTGGGTDNSAYGWFHWDTEHEGPAELGFISWKD